MSKYLQYYKDIFDGKPFIRHGKEVTINEKSVFDGGGIQLIYNEIEYELDKRDAATILDFGCGGAVHWHMNVPIPGLKHKQTATQYFGNRLRGFFRYDPAHPLYNIKPNSKFDIIICTEVMEHIPMDEIDELLTEMKTYLMDNGTVIFTIPKRLSSNSFPDGQNTHVTLMETKDWNKLFDRYFDDFVLIHHNK